MTKYIKICCPFVFLISLILILVFKTLPSGKLWKDYSVISVPSATNDSVVSAAIDKAGIKDYVSLSGQYLPLSIAENSIETSMLRLNYNNPEYSYLNKRNAMFFDKSNSYRLYYIPVKYSAEISSLVRILENQGIECIKDSSANYPWLLPFIAILLAGMLFLFVKNKLPFLCGAIITLVFLYSNPFYPVATACCLCLLCLFYTANVWRRKDALSCLLSRHSGPAMLAVALICTFSCSIASGFLFIAAVLGSAASLALCWYAEDFIRNRKPFVPVYIRSAKRVSMFAGKAFISMSIVTGTVLLFILLIFLTSSSSIKSSSKKLLFPGSSTTADAALPQFEEYFRWSWNVKTYPYRSLNSSQDSDNELIFSTFVENSETGIIFETVNKMKYDASFKKEIYDGIDKLQFEAVEKVMKSEGEDFCGGYTASSSYQINLFGIIMCFICFFILLFIYFSIII